MPETRAGVYVRISQDKTGEGLGVQRQEDDCRALAERKGWLVVAVYTDNDVSAYSGKERPEYRRMLEDIEAGAVTAVVAYRSDRLYRRVRDLVDLTDTVQRYGTEIATVASGDIDLTTADGLMIAGYQGYGAQAESHRQSERLKRQRLQAALEGKKAGGGRRPFGYVDSGMTAVDPVEAAHVRQAVDDLLAGATLWSIAARWNQAGIKTTAGNRWRTGNVRRMLLGEYLAGIRHHRPSGTRVPGVWEAIISADEHKLLTLRFPGTGAGKGNGPKPSRRRALLSGLVYCDACGKKLAYSAGRYLCSESRNGGCGLVLVTNGRALEVAVLNLAQELWQAEETKRASEPPTAETAAIADTQAELRAIEERAELLATMLADGDLDRNAYAQAANKLRTGRAELEGTLRRQTAARASREAAGHLSESFELWADKSDELNAQDVDRLQRPIRAVLGERVYVIPRPRRTKFDPAQVTLERSKPKRTSRSAKAQAHKP